MTDTVSVNQNNQQPPGWWTNKPFGLFTETLPRIYNQIVGRLSDNSLNEAMQRSGFTGTAGTSGSPEPISGLLGRQTQMPILPDLGGRDRTAGRQRGMPGRMERSEQYRQAQAGPVEQPMTASDYLAMYGGAFDETPYRNYMNFLMSQDSETMARINAMYEELAGEAEANMKRVGDVYSSAQATAGDIYGGSAQNIEDAYGSASQQAADQMARLGIEAAAPAVLNPMALSQAEAVSGVERAGAGALDALTRYGASAQDFGGQMAQVGQQQGLEVSQQILRDMAQRQAEAMFGMEQARASYNPYAQALQRFEFEQAFNEPAMRAQQAGIEAAQKAAELQLNTTLSRQDKILRIWTDIREDYENDEEAWQAATSAVQQAEAMYPVM